MTNVPTAIQAQASAKDKEILFKLVQGQNESKVKKPTDRHILMDKNSNSYIQLT